jgi:hypothetical protein
MEGSRPERHALHTAGLELSAVPERIGVVEGALNHVREPLDVGVRMHRPLRAGHQPIVVEDPERPDPHLVRIAIPIEGEVPASSEPPALFGVDLDVSSDLQHVSSRCSSPFEHPTHRNGLDRWVGEPAPQRCGDDLLLHLWKRMCSELMSQFAPDAPLVGAAWLTGYRLAFNVETRAWGGGGANAGGPVLAARCGRAVGHQRRRHGRGRPEWPEPPRSESGRQEIDAASRIAAA